VKAVDAHHYTYITSKTTTKTGYVPVKAATKGLLPKIEKFYIFENIMEIIWKYDYMISILWKSYLWKMKVMTFVIYDLWALWKM